MVLRFYLRVLRETIALPCKPRLNSKRPRLRTKKIIFSSKSGGGFVNQYQKSTSNKLKIIEKLIDERLDALFISQMKHNNTSELNTCTVHSVREIHNYESLFRLTHYTQENFKLTKPLKY